MSYVLTILATASCLHPGVYFVYYAGKRFGNECVLLTLRGTISKTSLFYLWIMPHGIVLLTVLVATPGSPSGVNFTYSAGKCLGKESASLRVSIFFGLIAVLCLCISKFDRLECRFCTFYLITRPDCSAFSPSFCFVILLFLTFLFAVNQTDY